MGMFSKLFKRKSFDELMEEYHSVGNDYLAGLVDEKILLEKQRKILRRAMGTAKNEGQKLAVNASILELEKRAQAVEAGVIRK